MTGSVYALLPAWNRFASMDDLRRRLARADTLAPGATNELAVSDCFRWPGGPLPVAALLREYLMHDAGTDAWICADLAHVEADMTTVRMLACGNLDVSRDEAEALTESLRPLFDDSGMALEATLPARWHLRLSAQAPVPPLDTPGDVLGDDLIDHLPAGDAARRWRRLLNETQILMHQNEVNRARAARGDPTANSVWLWGAGTLPAWIKTDIQQAYADDLLPAALAHRAGVGAFPLADFRSDCDIDGDVLVDMGQGGDADTCRDLLLGLLDAKRTDALVLHFASGERWRLRRGQRWRLWRHAP